MVREELISDLKKNIISTLNLQDLDPGVFGDDTPLFSDEGLGFDSVDALELVVMVENCYGITIGDKDEAKNIFASVSSLADYILAKGR